MSIIQCGSKNLPRDLDVKINVSRRTFETTTQLNVTCCVLKDGPLDHGAGRIRYYTATDQVADDWPAGSEARKAARDYFPGGTLALAQAFDTPQPGIATYGQLGDIDDSFANITGDGAFSIAIDGVSNDVVVDQSVLNGFSLYTSLARELQNQIRAAAGEDVTVEIVGGSRLKISSETVGDGSSVSVLGPHSAPPAGSVDISGEDYLNGRKATIVAGYTPTGFEGELDLIEEAARCSGRPVYGWDIDEAYRDSPDQMVFANWIIARTSKAIGIISSNSILARDAGNDMDVGAVVEKLGASALHTEYHDDPDYYPGMNTLSLMLAINFGAQNSVRTAKFLPSRGIPTVGLSVSEWTVLQSKGYNVYTATGNASQVYRDGINSTTPIWYLDQRITLDNFAEELSVALFNELKTGKLGINAEGQAIVFDAASLIGEKYIFNGALSPRRVAAPNTRAGYVELPAYDITLTPLELHTDAARAARQMTPMVMKLNLTDFAHTISVAVEA